MCTDCTRMAAPHPPPVTRAQVQAFPKVELHAHLSGCITQDFLAELAPDFAPFNCREDRDAWRKSNEANWRQWEVELGLRAPGDADGYVGAAVGGSVAVGQHQASSMDVEGSKSRSMGTASLSSKRLARHSDIPTDDKERRAKMWDPVRHCFAYFDSVGRVVRDLDALERCTMHVLREFSRQNCVYFELRTSPKELLYGSSSLPEAKEKDAKDRASKMAYLRVVKRCIRRFEREENASRAALSDDERAKLLPVMTTRLLLTVNRGTIKDLDGAVKQVDDILDLVREEREACHRVAAKGETNVDPDDDDADEAFPRIVGVDVAGNPEANTGIPYVIPALLSRSLQFLNPEGTEGDRNSFGPLPITFHTAEVAGQGVANRKEKLGKSSGSGDARVELRETATALSKHSNRPAGTTTAAAMTGTGEDETEALVHSWEHDRESTLLLRAIEDGHLDVRRFGHVCYLSDLNRRKVFQLAKAKRDGSIGVELCPTSNLITCGLESFAQHHLPFWFRREKSAEKEVDEVVAAHSTEAAPDTVAVSLNTDDTGLFSCDLTSEVGGMCDAFGLSGEELRRLQLNAIRSSFLRDDEKLELEAVIRGWQLE